MEPANSGTIINRAGRSIDRAGLGNSTGSCVSLMLPIKVPEGLLILLSVPDAVISRGFYGRLETPPACGINKRSIT